MFSLKHIYAVEITLKRETAPDGTVTETETVKVTYSQDWPAYNAAATSEKRHFIELLAGLCEEVEQPVQTFGRPRFPLADMVFAAAYKVYSGFSSRRFTTDLQEASRAGVIFRAPHFNSVSNYLSDPTLTPILKALIERAATPLRSLESDFAIDSSGFSTSRFDRWFDKKYGKVRFEHHWVKIHLICGVRTNVVTSVEVTPTETADAPQLSALLASTAQRFTVSQVSGDKAYSSRRNLHAIDALGATPYIPFKKGTKGAGTRHGFDGLWSRAWAFYTYNQDAFMAQYHKRSNVETTFSMIKAKFGDAVRSKSDIGQVNEVLCKVLCHNICCLIQSMYEFGVDPTFCAQIQAAQEVGA